MARIAGSSGEATARLIEEKSLQLFAQHGFAAVSMRQIASAVGVQASALYQYHATKQDLLQHVMQSHMEGLLIAWERDVREQPRGSLPVPMLEQFARFHIRYHLTRPDDVFISYMELRSLEPNNFMAIEVLRKQYEAILKEILQAGIADGSFRISDAHVSAMAILAMITGVNTWYRSGGRLSQSKIEDIYVSMVLGAVGANRGEF